MPKILLVNEYDTREQFEVTEEEAHDMLDYKVVFFCLADTIFLESNGAAPVGEPLIALHPSLKTREAFEEYKEAIEEVRSGLAEQDEPLLEINPLTGKRDGILKIVAKAKDAGTS